MADIKWIKITTDIFDDEKILLIESMPEANSLIVIWFKLLAFAGKSNNNGVFMLSNKIPYTDEMLATIFRRPVNVVRLALSTFESFGMIEYIDGVLTLPNWERHQSVDRLNEIREYNRLAQQKSRAKRKQLAAVNDKSMTSQRGHDTDIEVDKDIDIEIDKDNKGDKSPRATRFTPPTLEEVTAYCKERGNNVNPERFIDFYSSKGWMVGKNKMKDWKAAVRNWESRDKADKPKQADPEDYGSPLDFYK